MARAFQKDERMPCEEHVVEIRGRKGDGPATNISEMVKVSELRYTNSLDSATQWRQSLRRRPLCRCLSSAMTMVSFSMGILVIGSILGIRVLSWGLISYELQTTSEEGQKSQVEQMAKEVLAFFQVGSGLAEVTSQFYNISFARESDAAPHEFLSRFGTLEWTSLVQSVFTQDVMLVHARNPTLVSASGDPSCNTDAVLVGQQYMFDINPNTTGLTWEQAEEFNNQSNPGCDPSQAGCGLAAPGAILAGICGYENRPGCDPSDPLQFAAVYGNASCTSPGSGGNGEVLWMLNQLPGSFEGGSITSTSGLLAPQWQRRTIVDLNYGLVRQSVMFGLPGPPWAPQSAWGRVTMRVAGDENIFGTTNLQSILRQVSASSRDASIIFVLTGRGELLATSLDDQDVRVIEGDTARLVRGDDEGLVSDLIQPVAKALIERHCTSDTSGTLDCDWEQVSVLQYIRNYAVAAKPINDPKADGLGLLLVDIVDSGAITGRIEEINVTLIQLGIPIIFGAILLFVILSRQVTVPLRKARDNMFLLSDMKIDDAVAAYSEGGRCSRPLFTEAGDLQLSFMHAATALKAWRRREIERRTLLEEERAQRIQHTVEKAVQGAGKLMHPMVLISAEEFMNMQMLVSYEVLRNSGKLEFLDTEDDLVKFKTNHSVIFLSHQWLGWGYPDDEQQTQLKAMKSAVKTAAHQMRSSGARGAWKNMYVWVDYCSIAQEHRGMQTLAVSSLPVYASSADVFVIVAPPAKHVQSHNQADLHSYNSRGWCRAEMLSKICSSGLENFFVLSTEGGELQRVTEEWLPSLSMYVFEGDFSCCQQGHCHGACDKEALVEPVLGLYSLVLRQVNDGSGSARHMEQVLRHIRQSKERFFPRTYTYRVTAPEGTTTEERELFGPLVEALEQHMDREHGLRRAGSTGSLRSARSDVFWVF
ncbi:unnamed protein product [Prorocentrum cordatum]|uniref:Subtilisin n=1 Tax=Prorocentrum cordatum TaxID=2364126 RepID=A0ABN9PEN9_9DINO|nr:unnamed protein product [Polarella glacialis]